MKWVSKISVLVLCLYSYMVIKNLYFPIDEEPKKADVIIVLSGELGRLEKGYKLYTENYADKIMLSKSGSISFKIEFDNLNINPDEDYFIKEPYATSTYTNAQYTLRLMEQHTYKSALVVSSYYHMSRVKLIYERVFHDTGIELTYVSSFSPSINSERWIKYSRRYAFTEPITNLGYFFSLYKWIDL